MTLDLRAKDGHMLDACVDRIRALGHKSETFVRRVYAFDGSIRAVANGRRHAVRAWTDRTVHTGDEGVRCIEQKSLPVPYLDWPAASVADEEGGLTLKVLVTHKLALEYRLGKLFAVVMAGHDMDHHLHALDSVCATVDLVAVPRSALAFLDAPSSCKDSLGTS